MDWKREGNHRDDEVATAVAGRPEQTIETDVAQRAEHGRHMPVRQRAAHHDGLLTCCGHRSLGVEAIANIVSSLNQYGLHFALLDPHNLGALSFSIIE